MTLVDCEAERKKYKALLRFEEEARLLLIEGGKGWGKSTLLSWAQQNSPFFEDRAAVCLVDLDPTKLPESSPVEFELILKLQAELSQGDIPVPFPRFEPLNALRTREIAWDDGEPVAATVNAAGAEISGGVVAGAVQQVIQEMNIGGDIILQLQGPTWSDELEDRARQLCVRAFLEDLRQAANERPVVILFDHWDKANSELRRWVLNRFVMPFALLPRRPERMLITMAVKDLHELGTLGDEAMRMVERMGPLGQWSDEDVEEFVRHHYPQATKLNIAQIKEGLTQRQWSPEDAILLLETMKRIDKVR